MSKPDTKGLYKKFDVTRADTGEPVTEQTFTLLPESDPIATAALLFYARTHAGLTGSNELLHDVVGFLKGIGEYIDAYETIERAVCTR